MIISVDPSTAEDIATFAMVKQYTLQTLPITLTLANWTADAEHGGYIQTISQGITGSLVTFSDPSAIVSYNITDGGTSNFDIASLAGIILESITPGQTSYSFVFRADELPTDNVKIDVLVYGTQIVGGGSGGDPTSAEEITAAALQALNDRVNNLERGDMNIEGVKTFTGTMNFSSIGIFDRGTKVARQPATGKAVKLIEYREGQPAGQYHTATYLVTPLRSNVTSKANRSGIIMLANNENGSPSAYWITRGKDINISKFIITKEGTLITLWTIDDDNTADGYVFTKLSDTRSSGATYGFNPAEDTNEYNITSGGYNDGTTQHTFSAYVLSIDLLAGTVNTYLDAYPPMVRTANAQTIAGVKTFTSQIVSPTTGKWNRLWTGSNTAKWYELFRFVRDNTARYLIEINGSVNAESSVAYGKMLIICPSGATSTPFAKWISHSSAIGSTHMDIDKFALVFNDVAGYFSLYWYGAPNQGIDFNSKFSRVQDNMISPADYYKRGDSGFTPNDYDGLTGKSFFKPGVVANDAVLDAYAPMVRTSGNQNIAGRKIFTTQIGYSSANYPMYHTFCGAVKNGAVSTANASGMQYYSGDDSSVYLGRNCIVYDATTKRVSYDIRMNSIINSGNHARLFMEEKADGTFALSFWNGQVWVRLVQ